MKGVITLNQLGVMKKEGVSIAGMISGGGSETIRPATTSTLGGVIVGDGLSINSLGVLSAEGVSFDYSTTEFDTGQKWVDGSEIYARVITGNTTESQMLELPTASIGVKYVINIYGFVDENGTHANMCGVQSYVNQQYSNTHRILIYWANSLSIGSPYYFVIFYTKNS